MQKLFFDNWDSIIRTMIITIMSYVWLIVLLRSFGKRTLSKMNAFDLIITVALGSTLASVILTKDVALADGAVAFFLLIGLQFVITYISARNKQFSHLIKSTPTLLVYRGEMLKDFMKKERIVEAEIYAVLRERGLSSLEDAAAVVLETDGSMTVIKRFDNQQASAMHGVRTPQKVNLEMV